ncbi:MAG: alanine dehydrogenase [Acidobacteria bacterium]|nr:MAG: alanine dehydrogenase [Acidobacteriota bacterium]
MNIGLPKEVKDNEYRVGMVPAGVHALAEEGHKVWVQKRAGEGSGFADSEYSGAGGTLVETADEVFARSELIVKVKEPVPEEYPRLRAGQIVFSYLHLAPLPDLTQVLLDKKVVGVAYETIFDRNGTLPLLTPMSEIAGRMSVIVGAYYLQKPRGGRGVLLGGVPGAKPATVAIIGAGTVGVNAAKMAMGLGAHVRILDIDLDRLRHLDDLFFGKIETVFSNAYTIAEAVANAELVIGAVLIPGANAPKLITRKMVASMYPSAVIVDVAVDQGGCVETTRPTSHSDPVYVEEGILHYCVTNMPGAMPRSSTIALTNATLPYVRKIAGLGLKGAIADNRLLKDGVNTFQGCVTCAPVAESQNRVYTDLDQIM